MERIIEDVAACGRAGHAMERWENLRGDGCLIRCAQCGEYQGYEVRMYRWRLLRRNARLSEPCAGQADGR